MNTLLLAAFLAPFSVVQASEPTSELLGTLDGLSTVDTKAPPVALGPIQYKVVYYPSSSAAPGEILTLLDGVHVPGASLPEILVLESGPIFDVVEDYLRDNRNGFVRFLATFGGTGVVEAEALGTEAESSYAVTPLCRSLFGYAWATIERVEVEILQIEAVYLTQFDCPTPSFSPDGCTQTTLEAAFRIYGINGLVAQTQVRLGVPANPLALVTETGGPVIGTNWRARVDHRSFVPDSTLDLLRVSTVPDNQVSGVGTILLDLGTIIYSGVASPGRDFELPVPNDCSLPGLRLFTQAASVDPSGQVHLSNGLDLEVGSLSANGD